MSPDSPFDALTLILWFRDVNATGPPIYSIDFRSPTGNARGSHFANNLHADRFEWIRRFPIDFDTSTVRIASGTGTPNSLDSASTSYAFLRIQSVRPDDAGLFVCRADFRRGRTKYTNVRLQVYGKSIDIDAHIRWES